MNAPIVFIFVFAGSVVYTFVCVSVSYEACLEEGSGFDRKNQLPYNLYPANQNGGPRHSGKESYYFPQTSRHRHC